MSNFERGSLKQRAIAVAVASCYLTSAQANPTGGSVAAGNVVFDVNGKMLTITNSPGSIINWQQFSIQKDEITRFIQQNASSAALNRVGGVNNPSYILGTLRSELTNGAVGGRVFLINPSGIFFGPGSVINVGGLVASTLGMSDADFATAAAGGRMRFVGVGGEKGLRNAGEIRTAEGGHVYLIAPKVVNAGPTAGNPAGGVITSPKGEVIVAAGTSVELVNPGTPDIRVELTAPSNKAVNAGQIIAESGRVGIYGTLVKNSGLVSASAATLGDGGKIVFKALKDVTLDASSRIEANGAKGGDVTIQAETGTLLAQGVIEAKGAVEKGGKIQLLGTQVGLTGNAQVDASGQSGGGTVLVGGDQRGANPEVQNADAVYLGADTSIRADALESGDGGKLVVYSKNATRAYGTLSARGSASGLGGFVETSGRYLEVLQAPLVSGGLGGGAWLIDPYNIDIVAGNGTSNNTGTPDFTPGGDNSQIGADLISGQLNAGTNVTVDTGGPGSPGTQDGNLTVSAGINSGTSASLALHANNDVAINAQIIMTNGNLDVTAGHNVAVTQTVLSAGSNVTAGGKLSVVGSGGATAAVSGLGGGQTINAGAIEVRAQGGLALITNQGSGNQTINVNGGSLDVVAISNNASISNSAPGASQTITVTNGDHINVSASSAGTSASIGAANGSQTVSITGSGANVINLGSSGALGSSTLNALTQTVTAGAAGQSGSITIVGPAANNRLAAITTTPGIGGETQSVSTSGTISVTGGTAPAQGTNSNSGIFHSRQGQQSVTAANIVLQGGASGNGNGAFINSLSGGDQAINATGSINITGGTVGNSNKAGMSSTGNQTITGNPNITITGGASGGVTNANNNAFITAGVGKLQTISAGSISVTAGAGGTDNSGTITGATQVINATGNVALTGGGSGGTLTGARIGGLGTASPTDTNLTLTGGGDVILTGGSATNSGARLGSTIVATPLTNNVTVNAGGSVILNGGTGAGAAIGYSAQSPVPPAGGTISVTAGNAIQLNGGPTDTAIRTLGDVTLTAGSTISEGAKGLILANGLTTTTSGSTSLTGPNHVSTYNGKSTNAGIALNNTGALTVTGLQAATASSITNNGVMTINGVLNISAGSLNLTTLGAGNWLNQVGGSIQIQSGTLTTSSTGATSLAGPNQVPGFNGTTTGGDLTFNSSQSLDITGLNVVGNATVTTPTNLRFFGVASSTGNQSYSAATIDEGATGQIIANGLTISSMLDASLLGDNHVSSFNGTVTAGNLSLRNTGGLDLTGLNVSGFATILNAGDINVSGTVSVPNLGLSGTTISEGPSGRIVASGLGTTSSGNTTLLGANQVSSFSGTSGGDLAFNNNGDLALAGLSVAGNALVSATTITQDPFSQISATALTTTSVGSTTLGGPNAIASFNGTTAAGDLTLNNLSALDLTGLNVGGNATINNSSSPVIISGTASSSGNQTYFAGSVSEAPGGRILANGLHVQTLGGGFSLGGANQVSSVSGFALGTSDESVFNNTGTLNVTGLGSAGGLTLTNAGAVNVSGTLSAIGALSVTTTGAGSDLALASSVSSGGAMNINGSGNIAITGAVLPLNPTVPPFVPVATSVSSGGPMTINATGNIAVTAVSAPGPVTNFSVSSTGAMTLAAGGALSVGASGSQNVSVSSNGGQTINAQSLAVTAQDARLATLSNGGVGTQSININGGSLDVVATAGNASISTTGGIQQITVTNGDHINVNGAGLNTIASISANNGAQTLAITGSGNNKITLGAADAAGSSTIIARTQTVTAGATGSTELGSITVAGGVTNGRAATFQTTQSTGSQSVSTTGELKVTGGTASAQALTSGVFHLGSGTQTVSADTITLNGGASGSGNGAQISSQVTTSGAQTITASNITVKGGSGTSGNVALMRTVNANQTIKGFAGKPDPVIKVTGGDSGGVANSGNAAAIQANGVGRTQTIAASSISITAGATGTDNSATITGNTQNIDVTGGVTLTGGGSAGNLTGARIGGAGGPTSTNLTLNAGGDVVLTGGSQTNAGARLGSGVATTPVDSNVTVKVTGGKLVLNEGTGAGAAIGYSALSVPGGGTITLTAQSIEMNGTTLGTQIRTLGNVELHTDQPGGTITQSAASRVLANGLTTTSNGATNLGGTNQVSSFNGTTTGGDLTLNNTGALNVTGISTFGNTALTNAGAINASGPINTAGTLAVTTTGIGSDLTITNTVASGGAATLNVAGALAINASGTRNATVTSNGQTVNAQSLTVSAQNGRLASLTNGGASQTITVSGGAGIDVVANSGGTAQIVSGAPGAIQTITATNADHINVNGAGGNASIAASLGSQTISITGSGANAINLGSSGALGSSTLNASTQAVTAGAAGQSGSITIVGPAANNRLAAITTTPGVGGETQTVSTSGTISVTGGTAPAQGANSNSGVFHSRQGQQSVTATNIVLQGGASGNGNGAFINSLSGGDQIIKATGNINITGGTVGNTNKAGMTSTGNQTVNGNPNITITGGASGGTAGNGNNAFINAGDVNKTQTVNAGSITINAGAAGTDNSATINGAKQTVIVAGNVTLNGGGATGTANGSRIGGLGGTTPSASDLTLTAGGDVILTGGQNNSGAALGSASATPPLDGKLAISAGGSVVLNAGTGAIARIGGAAGAVGGGNISVSAGNSIQLNGNATQTSAIRTTGDVTLTAGTMSEGANGQILANNLTLKASGNADLTGPNQVASLSAPTSGLPPTPGVGGSLSFNNAGALKLNDVSSGGTMNLTVAGGLTISASGTQNAVVSSSGGQTISAQSLIVSARDGRTASLSNNGGTQTINIAGGGASAGIDVQTLSSGGSATIANNAVGSTQSISVTNADHINVNGAGGNASINANAGTQTISITGSGANAINLGSSGALGSSALNALAQTVTAGAAGQSGSITIVGPAANNRLAAITTTPGTGGETQTVSTSGTISVTGGTAPAQSANSNSGIFHSRQGQQSVSAANIVLQGGASGNGNGAFINSLSGGDQTVNVTGLISITGGTGVAGNKAGMNATNASQTISAGAINITGGASGGIAGNGNNGFLQSSGATKVQTVNAGSISVTAGAGGIDNSGSITGMTQTVTATGNVTLTGGGTTGTSNGARIGGAGGGSPSDTNLTLNAGGNVILNGGSADGSGARLGSAAVATPLTNNVIVNAGGSVILNGGTAQGAAIGYSVQAPTPPAGGTIKVTAGNSIQLNGGPKNTSIRTLGDVTLTAGNTISEGANGFILANALTTTSGGDTSLTGPNQVASFTGTSTSGSVTFNNIGALAVNSVVAANNIALTNLGAMSINGAISTPSGSVSLNADSISEGASGLIAANSLTLKTSGNADLTGANQVSTLNAPGTVVPEVPPTLVPGVGGNLSFNNTAALSVGSTAVGGALNLTTTSGDLNVTNVVTSGGAMNVNAAGALNVNGAGLQDAMLLSNSGQTITAQSVNLTAQNNRLAIIQNQGSGSQTITATAGGINLQALGGSGVAQIVNSALGGSQIVSMTGLLNVLGGTTNIPGGSRNSGIFQNGTGAQSVTSTGITLQASPTGNATPSGALISALGGGDQFIDAGTGDISLIAGSGGTANNALISGLGNQNIHAHNISAANGTDGTNAFAGILAPHQSITATGDVTLTSQAGLAAGGSLPGVRIGGNGGATDLNLHVDGNLTLSGGTAENNGIGIGSSAVGTPLANNITISTGGSVILNSGTASGTGARIGAGPNGNAGGNISITAGGDIQLNGTAQPTVIRTLDNVGLSAANISESANGFILANGLTTTTSGSTSLTGPNQVASFNGTTTTPGANLTFNNSGALNVAGISSLSSTSLTNAGSVSVSGLVSTSGTLDITTTGAGSNLAIANNVSSGPMNLNVAGGLSVTASGTQSAFVFSNGAQTVNAQSLTVSGQSGQVAVLGASGGSQNIAISGGGVDVQALSGGFAQLSTQGPGANQTITVGNGPGINVNGIGGNAIVISSGAQTLSTTGSGANAINVGSAGAAGFSNIIGQQGQSITAASITVQGGASGSNHGASISSQGPQTINATSVSVQGGAGGSNNVASVSSTGTQAITAANVAVQGGSGTGNGAFITSNGDQTINANTVSVTGGTLGNGNRALITTIANQTIAASQNIAVTGGASGGIAGSSNFASISGGGLGMLQKINAGSISVSSGAGGIDNSATITGAKQIIAATGNVTVSGSGSTGTLNGSRIGGVSAGASSTATDLTLTADGDVILTGGSVPLAGARLGSTGGTTPLANNITVTAGGSVILNEGPAIGSAIGYSSLVGVPAGGNISVTAGNSIQLNGATAIRTLGDVTLAAGTISESSNGLVTANNLTTTSTGNTNLIGSNRVSSFSGSSTAGSVNFNNIGALAVNSVVAANNAALTNLGAMSVNGPMSAGGTLSVTADSVNGAGNIATGGGFIVNVAGESLLSGVISGAGGLSKQGAGTLTVSGNNTYAGDTDVLVGTLAIGGSDRTNDGVVNIFSGATYRGSAGSFTNSGVIGGNGTLDMSATSFTNSGTLRPGGSGAIGTLTVLGNATFGPSSLIDIEAQGAGSGNHDVLAITGAATLGGNLNVTNIIGYAPLADDAITPVTYASRTGTLGISPDSWLPTYNPASLTLVFDPNVNRWIGTSGNWNVAANWSRGHTPLAFETALIDVAGNQLVTVSDGARAAGKLRSSEDFLISGGSLSLGGASFFYAALSLTGGTLQGAGNITVNGAFNWSGGALAGAGQFITAPTALSTLAPSAHNLMLGRTWLNQGHVMWQSSNGRDLVIAEGASLVNALGAEVTLAAAQGGNIKGDGAFSNAGTVNKNGVDTNAIKAGFTNSATGVLNVNSGTLKLKRSASNEGSIRIAGGATLLLKQDYINYGRLSGNGILDASGVSFTNLGVLAPGGNDGAGVGTFTIHGDYRQGSTGVLDMGLGGVAAGQYDVLAVSDKAFLGGTLRTSAVNGYAPAAGDSFKLITYKSRSGEFSTTTAPAGLALDADYMKRFGIFELQ